MVTDQHDSRRTVVEIDLDTFPYLVDHRLQGLVVLPGSAYLEMARAAIPAPSRHSPRLLRNVAFERLCAFADRGTHIFEVDVSAAADGGWQLQFLSRPPDPSLQGWRPVRHARLSIPGTEDDGVPRIRQASFQEIRSRCGAPITGAEFYRQLRESGNEFGAAFQGIDSLSCAGREAVATLSIPRQRDIGTTAVSLHAPLLDIAAQLLAAIARRPGRTFVLVSVDSIRTHGSPASCTWGHARRMQNDSANNDTLVGDVALADGAGTVLAEFIGVRLQYFNVQQKRAADAEQPKETIALSATFTADPLRDSLEYWAQALDLPCDIVFAPYGQPLQQLLDPSSVLARNRRGLNVILVRFEDWLPRPARSQLEMRAEKAHLLVNRSRYVLPNGMEIADLNHYETEHLYDEIFAKRSYLRHGIVLEDGDCVVDAGANIGLFTLFVQQERREIRVCAIEPAPAAAAALRVNTALYGLNVDVIECGLSDERTQAWLTVYPRSSLFTGFYGDPEQDRATLRTVVKNLVRRDSSPDKGSAARLADELIAGRLDRGGVLVPTRTLSDIIREQRITRIDLLKVDVEKGELRALQGIEEQHWPIIRQMAIEVHDSRGELTRAVRLLLEEKGFNLAVAEDEVLRGSGLRTLYARRPERQARPALSSQLLERSVSDLVAAVDTLRHRTPVPCLVVVCPASPAAKDDAGQARLFASLEERLAERTPLIVGSPQLLATYPADSYDDPHGDALGHVPYTPAGFAAIGTMIARRARSVMDAPYKVVVLDCDQTLWKGLCGESGPRDIEIDPPRSRFQAFLVHLHRAGMLLCLCSKNHEADVLAAFARHQDMPLRLEHCVARRINWASKSQNIRSLADELHVGLDSVVFIDDDPVECAEVRCRCPEVLTVQFPGDPAGIDRFSDHVWAFDQHGSTEEDRRRTLFHQENGTRERFRQASLTLGSFIAGLDLKCTISVAEPRHFARIAQLTERTNQFTLTTVRRSEAEVRRLVQSGVLECLVVDVSDRFGDYGLVGTVSYAQMPKGLLADTFALSCRALGRGVEHLMLARLGEIALARGLERVQLLLVPGVRNQPARDFLDSLRIGRSIPVGGHAVSASRAAGIDLPADALIVTVAARSIAGLRYDPDASAQQSMAVVPAGQPPSSDEGSDPGPDVSRRLSMLGRIPTEMADLSQILRAIEAARRRPRPGGVALVSPETEMERVIAAVWRRVLGVERVGIDDNFFTLGGGSLKAVQVIAELRRMVDPNIPVASLFDKPTIRTLATSLSASGQESPRIGPGLSSRQRGERRRQKSLGRLDRAQR